MIKKLHRVWINDNPEIPYHLYRKEWIESWERLNPEWEFTMWDDESSRGLIETHYPWFLPVYDGYAKPIFKADAVRYFILHHIGGLYVDLDFECFRPVDEVFESAALCLLSKNPSNGFFPEPMQPRNLVNNLMYSIPGHRFWKHVIKYLLANHSKPTAMYKTGPLLLTGAYLSYVEQEEDDITLLDPKLFLPYLSNLSAAKMGEKTQVAKMNEKGADYFPGAYGAHRWVSFWT